MATGEANTTTEPAPLRVPADWADVTPQWMTAALADHHPDAEVRDATLVTRDDGTNRRARFELTYAAGSGPARVFLKAEGIHREVHARNGNLFNESELYASREPLPLDHPLCYRAVIDRPGLDYVLVMEDVTDRGGDPRDSTRPLTVDQVANGLRGLARLHSRYWEFTAATRPKLAWVQTWAPTEGFQIGLRRFTPRGLERGAHSLPAEVTKYDGDGIVDLWASYVATLDRGPLTLLHADAHIGNTYVLPGDDVGFLDWQVVRRGAWPQDVAYFLVGALTVEDRRRAERDLLGEYLAALDVPARTRPSADDAWLHYRACAAYGLAIWLSTLGTDGYQSQEISLLLAERYAAAFVDLETEPALARLQA
ncbi:aminoglycoside phosphotransferase [Frankia sp. CNm7]|uniref:Aminoglycoside phosphotransferase n=1 Tax=Frankia nepalensis TaxID=1836974 RepID=A0A937RLY4_9ACTN|nr:aminoglycoside phosphotransferase [Frankia nepalensis]MBL7501932.1 aminoglycoside phosphotransferase [Frankia nepalensis]MBL7514533.1 aminoglycoside phosphotransferase [Frankia nepalensis]MBL7524181.1 aminoglycoside phosphotransferase [Frankia nepalensis]MBL7628808.1 aminoglycoside phosphotransferase [Frankia nepalensis]